MDILHRITTGQALTPMQLRLGGAFVLLWVGMDVIQFVDMVVGWFR